MLTKTQLKEIFAQYDFAPLKKLGENYLIDANIKDKIISSLQLSKADRVLEIGPGLGALTIDLAKSCAKLFAVEKDRKACGILKDLACRDFPNLEIINGDILKFDLSSVLASGHKLKIAGNLPYYITTPIIEYILENKRLVSLAVIMIQKEVAARLLAKPNTKDYSSLSCFIQYHARPEYIYTVKRTCFYPAPEVDSAILRLHMLDSPPVEVREEERLFKIIRGAFNQRRKSIINSLAREAVLNIPKEELSDILKTAGIDSAARPETLSLADFARITNAVAKLTKAGGCGNL